MHNRQEWHRTAVGGLWGQLGPLQLDFLTGQGLTPDMTVLDIGRGSLRAGVHLIGYLDPDRYTGIDKDPALIQGGVRARALP